LTGGEASRKQLGRPSSAIARLSTDSIRASALLTSVAGQKQDQIRTEPLRDGSSCNERGLYAEPLICISPRDFSYAEVYNISIRH
jgi:hypothetical protein